jgi:hypothetical protein
MLVNDQLMGAYNNPSSTKLWSEVLRKPAFSAGILNKKVLELVCLNQPRETDHYCCLQNNVFWNCNHNMFILKKIPNKEYNYYITWPCFNFLTISFSMVA